MSDRYVRARRQVALLATALCFAALTGLASTATEPPVAEGEAPVSAPPSLLSRNFAIFRTAPEELPSAVVADFDMTAANGPFAGRGFNLALTQRAVVPGAKAPLWLVPGYTELLLIDEIGGHYAAVSRIRLAIDRGLGLWTGVPRTADPHRMRVVGVAPDGVSAVRVAKGTAAIVRNNAFTTTIPVGHGLGGPWKSGAWVLLHGVPTAS